MQGRALVSVHPETCKRNAFYFRVRKNKGRNDENRSHLFCSREAYNELTEREEKEKKMENKRKQTTGTSRGESTRKTGGGGNMCARGMKKRLIRRASTLLVYNNVTIV